MLENLKEVHDVYDAIFILFMCLSFGDHVQKLSFCHVFSDLLCDSLKVFEGDVVLVFGEENEGLLELGVVISFGHLCDHDVLEVFEVDQDHALFIFVALLLLRVIVKVRYQSLDLLLLWFEAEGSESDLEVLDIDATAAASVEQVKCLLYFRSLLVGESLAHLTLGLLLGACSATTT